jgi:hypothetical protein
MYVMNIPIPWVGKCKIIVVELHLLECIACIEYVEYVAHS